MSTEALIAAENRRATYEWQAFCALNPGNYTAMSQDAKAQADALAERQGQRLAAIFAKTNEH